MLSAPEDAVSLVVLAKHADEAKRRLELPADEARAIARDLAARTVRVGSAAASVGMVWVVTSDPVIARDAVKAGAFVSAEGRSLGMNRAAALGRRQALATRPNSPVVIVVADLPFLQPNNLDSVVAEFWKHRAPTYVADHHGTGTTLLMHGPHDLPRIAFGRDSAHMHHRLGYQPARRSEHGLRADLDTPEDLEEAGLLSPNLSGKRATPPATSTLGSGSHPSAWVGPSVGDRSVAAPSMLRRFA